MLEFIPESHAYKLDGQYLPSVTTIIKDMGLYGDVTTYFTDYARERGSLVHRIIEWYLSGELDEDTIDPSLAPYFAAWKRFQYETGFVSTITEQPMASEIHRFAGTPDHIGKFNGSMSVVDVKTGADNPATGLQLAAYEILSGWRLRRYSLQLNDDGKYKLTEFKDRNDRSVFLSALACYQWKKNNLKKG